MIAYISEREGQGGLGRRGEMGVPWIGRAQKSVLTLNLPATVDSYQSSQNKKYGINGSILQETILHYAGNFTLCSGTDGCTGSKRGKHTHPRQI